MTDSFDPIAIMERYADETDEALIRIAFAEADSYREEAIELARAELRRRGVEQEHPSVAREQLAVDSEAQDKARLLDAPLGGGYVVICFVFADIFAVIIALIHSGAGKKRAAREAWKWMAYGWVARIALIAVVIWWPR